ncbi:hypothetical protein C1H46_027278 [Malus baccata]|uniref:RING-type E3 ubiquitin transferase n=1 Tax=Malus baccata TaxID=106549 RepID=A0A540LKY7_MALBA|nr:hypothetical protein C1H46_027278 [Malus baccata]
MAETPYQTLPPPRSASEVEMETMKYWCYRCNKRVSIETMANLPDIVCHECKNGFVELILAASYLQSNRPSWSSDQVDNPTLGSPFLQHRLLDVVNAVEGYTKCDLDESRFRAVAILDLMFLVHVMFVLLIVMVTYAVVAKFVGIHRLGSYEALPNTAPSSDHNHIQMKALSDTQA